jgi:UDP-glucose 4-epimerase
LSMRVMVTGGAGYIGSVVSEELMRDGHEVVVYDNLQKGHLGAVVEGAPFIQADLLDGDLLRDMLKVYRIEAVVHMAADSLVGESVEDPAKYYCNNLMAGLSLLRAMRDCKVSRIVFSSTAAVYGEPEKQPVEEDDPTDPTNPYGETKLAFERALHWHEAAYGIRYVSLRYFNAAGASRQFGEAHEPETHLIPIICQAAIGKRSHVKIYGEDYPTRDGTCVRDYVHVVDLARAHILALSDLDKRSAIYNLGCGGEGYSVREVIEAAGEVTGIEIPVEVGPRRAGDPAMLIASSEKIRRELDWRPQMQDLRAMIESTWNWMQEHPSGYEKQGLWAWLSRPA